MEDTSTLPYAGGLERVGDVLLNADQLLVRATCSCCGHVADLDWSALAVAYSAERSLRSLARSIRCKACGGRGCGWQVAPRMNEHPVSGDPSPPQQTV